MNEVRLQSERKWKVFLDRHRAEFLETGLPLRLMDSQSDFVLFIGHGYFEDRSDPYVFETDASAKQKEATKQFLLAYFRAGFRIQHISMGANTGHWNAELKAALEEDA